MPHTIVQCTTYGGCVIVPLWLAALGGWFAVAAGLRRGLTGRARVAAQAAHALTIVMVLLGGTVFGYGLLFMTVTATGAWWALLIVTRFRPERLVDPPAGALGTLGGWLVLSAAAVTAGHLVVGGAMG